jgi:hypothetical protein
VNDFAHLTREELREANEQSGLRLNLVEANVLRALKALRDDRVQDVFELVELIPLIEDLTDYTAGQITTALWVLHNINVIGGES